MSASKSSGSLPGRLGAALQRLAGPAGPWLNRSMALLVAVWATHAVLRIAFLFRSDGFGLPIVGKPDWYIFHAFFLDLHWIFLVSLPGVLALSLAARYAPKLCRPLFTVLCVIHGALLVLTVIDQETLRFMGMHFDPDFARTYGNTAAVRQVFHFLASDASVKGLPYALFFGCLPLAAACYALLQRSAWARSAAWSLKPVAWVLAACLVGYLYVYRIWPGDNRMRLLRPVVTTMALSFKDTRTPDVPPDSLALLMRTYRTHWRLASGDSDWVFPLPEYPYYREPLERFCAGSRGDSAVCREDADGDGYPKSSDCLDSDPRVHPGAAEIGANGLDEDCNGTDAQPWNFVLFILESHRAVNVGHLKPYGSLYASTPFLDSLAGAGRYWTRLTASGVPTINALVSMHLSVPQHPTRTIASDLTGLRHEAFTTALNRHGYATHFFSAADPAWDNQTPWLRQWYQGYSYNRNRENDAATFAHMFRWMRDSLPPDHPFFVSVMTKTNHYPFNGAPGAPRLPDTASLVTRMNATMRYTDSSMRVFVDSLRRLPSFRHTLLLVVADHGFPLGEHGSYQIGHGLYTESVWLPFVIAGNHPRLGPPGARHDLASEIDIGPTILDLAGIREPNSYAGHSLLSPALPDRQSAFLARDGQAMLEHGKYRWHGAWGSQPREQGEELFDLDADPLERRNLIPTETPAEKALRDSLAAYARGFTRLHMHVLEKNVLWPDSAADPKGRSEKGRDQGG